MSDGPVLRFARWLAREETKRGLESLSKLLFALSVVTAAVMFVVYEKGKIEAVQADLAALELEMATREATVDRILDLDLTATAVASGEDCLVHLQGSVENIGDATVSITPSFLVLPVRKAVLIASGLEEEPPCKVENPAHMCVDRVPGVGVEVPVVGLLEGASQVLVGETVTFHAVVPELEGSWFEAVFSAPLVDAVSEPPGVDGQPEPVRPAPGLEWSVTTAYFPGGCS